MIDAAGPFGPGNHDVVKKKACKQHEEDMGGCQKSYKTGGGVAGLDLLLLLQYP